MTQSQTTRLQASLDRCVKCALCLPVCPTYRQTRDEAESPRGRIALFQGVLDGALSAADAAPHIANCLACRACENVCPAGVPYGEILDQGRERLRQDHAPAKRADRLFARALASPRLVRLAASAYRFARRIPGLASGGHRVARLMAMPGDARPTLPAVTSSEGPRGRVALATGCVNTAFDDASNAALVSLLRACGYGVRPVAGCCGALYQHHGELASARRLAKRRLADLDRTDDVAVIHPASGCAATIKDYAVHVDSAAAKRVADRVVDACAFLHAAGLSSALAKTNGEKATVAVHIPCTQRNVTGGEDALRALLDATPNVRSVVLTGDGCCGAAGSQMLSRPVFADALADAMLEPLYDGLPADLLLSANIGCAWHLRAALTRRGRPLEVLHPARFFARRLAP